MPGRTNIPPMSSCLNCHRLDHGPQGVIARGGCRDCHPASMNLRPRSHVRGFPGRPHAVQAKRGLNDCMMCHKDRTCKACHRRRRVKDTTNRLYIFQAIVPEAATSQPTFIVDLSGPTVMGQCAGCHVNLDAFKSKKVIFNHSIHLARGFRCDFCHAGFPHSQRGTATPPMETCYACHGTTHGARGVIATEDCYACHPKDFNLVPRSHYVPKWKTKHKRQAKANIGSCLMCHKQAFCSDCHMKMKAVPKDHKAESQWRGGHGQQFLQMKQNCRICHTEKNCDKCHRVKMPHPEDWPKTHRIDGKTPNNCVMCHSSQFCGKCHHQGIGNALLVRATCVRCHSIMRLPWESIRHKGMIVHAAHFKKKFRCEECHPSVETGKGQAHNFELCYECHGALDINKRLIAPYPGSQLCLRCHQKRI